MNKVLSVFCATVVMAASAQFVCAEKVRPTYTYAGIQYINQDLDDNDCSQDGLQVEGSYDVDKAFFVQGSFADVSGDSNCGSSSFKAGGGYRAGWGETSHVYGLLSVQDVSVDVGSGDSGLTLAGGLRGYIIPGIEAYGEVEYSTLFDGDVSLNAGGAYWFNGQFSVTGDLSLGGDQTSFAIGGRMTF